MELSPSHLDMLASVCRVHAALQAERAAVAIDLRSLHRLREAVETIVDHEAHDARSTWRPRFGGHSRGR